MATIATTIPASHADLLEERQKLEAEGKRLDADEESVARRLQTIRERKTQIRERLALLVGHEIEVFGPSPHRGEDHKENMAELFRSTIVADSRFESVIVSAFELEQAEGAIEGVLRELQEAERNLENVNRDPIQVTPAKTVQRSGLRGALAALFRVAPEVISEQRFDRRPGAQSRLVVARRRYEQVDGSVEGHRRAVRSANAGFEQALQENRIDVYRRRPETEAQLDASAERVFRGAVIDMRLQYDRNLRWNAECVIYCATTEGDGAFDTAVRLSIPSDRVNDFLTWIEQSNPRIRPEWYGDGALDLRNAWQVGRAYRMSIRFPLVRQPEDAPGESFDLPGDFLAEFGPFIRTPELAA